MSDVNVSLCNQLDRVLEKNRKLEAENAELKEKLEYTASEDAWQSVITGLEAERDALKSEKLELAAQATAMKSYFQEDFLLKDGLEVVEKLTAERDALKAERDRYRSELELIRDLIEHDPRSTKNERHICSIATAALAASPAQPVEAKCSCLFTDAWRCARDYGFSACVSCSCKCHKPAAAPIEVAAVDKDMWDISWLL